MENYFNFYGSGEIQFETLIKLKKLIDFSSYY